MVQSLRAALVAAILSSIGACAPVEGVDANQVSTPTVGQRCESGAADIPNASCRRCVNTTLACIGNVWDCLGPRPGEVCVPITDAATPPADASADAAPTGDVSSAADVTRADVATDAAVPTTDVGSQLPGTPCTNGVGACARRGVYIVDTDGGLPYCATREVGQPGVTEICDGMGVDENCNGMVNEGCECAAGAARPCYGGPANTAGRGICTNGRQVCGPDGRWGTACIGEVRPTTEICTNGRDDNCNGLTDEPACISSLPVANDGGTPTPR